MTADVLYSVCGTVFACRPVKFIFLDTEERTPELTQPYKQRGM